MLNYFENFYVEPFNSMQMLKFRNTKLLNTQKALLVIATIVYLVCFGS